MVPIQFGTSGWRAHYHHDFNFENVALVIQAIADEVKRGGRAGAGVVVGYDVRFMGREFAELACRVLAANGIASKLTESHVPTPCLAHAIVHGKHAGGINFTASHNPYEYNGVKYSAETGGPALPESTKRIEARVAELQSAGVRPAQVTLDEARERKLVVLFDPRPAYFTALAARLDTAAFAKLRGLGVAVDCKHSVARGYLDAFLREQGVAVTVINAEPDPYFGFEHPEPSAGHVDALQEMVRSNDDIVLGLACDGDADRFGVVDRDGAFIEANVVAALLLDYLAGSRAWKGGAARSVATTHLIDRVAAKRGLKLHETPVGFKYIGDLLVRGEIDFGAEESAGVTIQGHLPEKDGVLACLLVAEMAAATGESLGALTKRLFGAVGPVHDARTAVRLTTAMDAGFAAKVANPPATVARRSVARIDRTDGTKLFLDGGEWVLLRKSGTEPVVRLYAESEHESRLPELMAAVREWLGAT